ncbi:unnamed protein product [Clonostachys byssicola]|uniref:Uncharacterized protein n=1 Tax=Clonostachys byssicola TaxID=160290 RepID=A0A9N9UWI5_9HYPO|nr:unnamed protein product [Clonostachys byssicola]
MAGDSKDNTRRDDNNDNVRHDDNDDNVRRDDNDDNENIQITLKNERTLLYWWNDHTDAGAEYSLLPSNWSATASVSISQRGTPIIYFRIKVKKETFLFMIPLGNVDSISTAFRVDIQGIPGHYHRTNKWCTVGIHLMKRGVLAKKSVPGTMNLAVAPQELKELASATSVSALLPIRHKPKFDFLPLLLMRLDGNTDDMGDLLRSHGPLQIIRVNEVDTNNKAPIPIYLTQEEKQTQRQEKKIFQRQRVLALPVKTESLVKERQERADQQAKARLDKPCQSWTQANEYLLSRIETLEHTVHWMESDVDDAVKKVDVQLYDFRQEMNISKEKSSEEFQQLIDGVRKDLQGQLMEEMREKSDKTMNTIYDGDNYRLDIFFDETRLQSTKEV